MWGSFHLLKTVKSTSFFHKAILLSQYYGMLKAFRWRGLKVILVTIAAGLSEGIAILMLFPMLNYGLGREGTGIEPKTIRNYVNWDLEPSEMAVVSIGAFLLIGLTAAVMKWYSYILNSVMVPEIKEFLQNEISKLLFKMDWEEFLYLKTGGIVIGVSDYAQRAATSINSYIGVTSILLTIVFQLAFVIFIAPSVTLITLIFALGLGVGHLILGNRTERWSKKLVNASGDLNKITTELYGNFKYHRCTSAVTRYTEVLSSVYLRARKAGVKIFITLGLGTFIFEGGAIVFISSFLMISIFVLQIPIAETLIFLGILSRIIPRLLRLQNSLHSVRRTFPWAEAWLRQYRGIQAAMVSRKGREKANFKDFLEVRGVSFSYKTAKSNKVLDKLNFKLQPSGCVAIIGKSGGGKTTLLDLITGLLHPTEGEILLDGVPLSKIDVDSWHSKIGLVLQDSLLFNTTILENITEGATPDMDWAVRCVKLASAWDFIEELPEKLHTQIGEKGARLSNGQRQRIAIARALYRKPSILILDEATSALDTESERQVCKALNDIKGEVAMLIVTHRAHTASVADEILYLENGSIVKRSQNITNDPPSLAKSV